MNGARLWVPITFAVFAIIGFAVVMTCTPKSLEWGVASALTGVMIFGVLWSFTDWFFLALSRWITDIVVAKDTIWKNRLELAKTIADYRPDQTRALTLYVPTIVTTMGALGPSRNLDTDGTEAGWIPMRFVRLFIALGNREKLAAHGLWSEGTDERKWAVAMTKLLITMGFATERTNRTATWTDFDGAQIALFGPPVDEEI